MSLHYPRRSTRVFSSSPGGVSTHARFSSINAHESDSLLSREKEEEYRFRYAPVAFEAVLRSSVLLVAKRNAESYPGEKSVGEALGNLWNWRTAPVIISSIILGALAGYFYWDPAADALGTLQKLLKDFSSKLEMPEWLQEILTRAFQVVGAYENAALTALTTKTIIDAFIDKFKSGQAITSEDIENSKALLTMVKKVQAGLDTADEEAMLTDAQKAEKIRTLIGNAKAFLKYNDQHSLKKFVGGLHGVACGIVGLVALSPIPFLDKSDQVWQKILMFGSMAANAAPNIVGVLGIPNPFSSMEKSRAFLLQTIEENLTRFCHLPDEDQDEIINSFRALSDANEHGQNTKKIIERLINLVPKSSAQRAEFEARNRTRKWNPASGAVPEGASSVLAAASDHSLIADGPGLGEEGPYIPEPEGAKTGLGLGLGITAGVGALGYTGDTFINLLKTFQEKWPERPILAWTAAVVISTMTVPAFGGLGYLGGKATGEAMVSDKKELGEMYYKNIYKWLARVIMTTTVLSGFTNFQVNTVTMKAIFGTLPDLLGGKEGLPAKISELIYGATGTLSAGVVNGRFTVLLLGKILEYFGDQMAEPALKRRVDFVRQMRGLSDTIKDMSTKNFQELFLWMLDPALDLATTEPMRERSSREPRELEVVVPLRDATAIANAKSLSNSLHAMIHAATKSTLEYDAMFKSINDDLASRGLPPLNLPRERVVSYIAYKDYKIPGCLDAIAGLFTLCCGAVSSGKDEQRSPGARAQDEEFNRDIAQLNS